MPARVRPTKGSAVASVSMSVESAEPRCSEPEVSENEASESARPLPSGRHGLSRAEVEASQRVRMLDAVAAVVSEKGYGATTIADVVSRAGVSRSTFYEHFRSKEECFLAAFDMAIDVLLGGMAAGVEGAGFDWRDQVRSALGSALRVLADEPEYARAMIVEAAGAGEAALARRVDVYRRFGRFFAEMHRQAQSSASAPDPLPDDVLFAMVAGVAELISLRLLDGRAAELPAMEPKVSYLVFRVLTTPEEAQRVLISAPR